MNTGAFKLTRALRRWGLFTRYREVLFSFWLFVVWKWALMWFEPNSPSTFNFLLFIALCHSDRLHVKPISFAKLEWSRDKYLETIDRWKFSFALERLDFLLKNISNNWVSQRSRAAFWHSWVSCANWVRSALEVLSRHASADWFQLVNWSLHSHWITAPTPDN